MRNTLILLSSLALAAASGAAPFSVAVATASNNTTYTMDAGVSLVSVTNREYYPDGFHAGINYYTFDTYEPVSPTNANVGYTGFTTIDLPTSGGRVSLSATSSLRLDPNAGTEDTYALAHLGHAAYLTFTNVSGADAQVHFGTNWSGSYSAAATRPSNAAGDSVWDYAGAQAISGIGELDQNGDVIPAGYHAGNIYDWSFNFGSKTIRDTLSDSFDDKNLSFSYTLRSGETKTYEIWAAVSPEVAYINPVPEPASMFALGVGALGLLRRRKARS